MIKFKITTLLILIIQVISYGQWEQKNISTNSTLSCVDFITDDTGFVTGSNKIFKTENGGDNWTTSHTSDDFVVYEDIFTLNNDEIIAVGKDLSSNQSIITKTENGGANWVETTLSNSSFLKSVFFSSPDIGYCSGGGGTIFKSTDSGDTWGELNSGTTTNIQSIYFVNDLVGIAVGGSPTTALILKTQDGGVNWSQINSPSNNNLQSVFFSNQETAYVVGWFGEIIKTTDCGNSWTNQNSISMSGNLEVIFTDENTGYIVGGSMNESLIQKTSNGGDLWEDVSPQVTEGLVGIHFPSFDVGYSVGSNGIVVKTESGGIMTAINDLETVNDINVVPNPTTGILKIQSKQNSKIERIRIYDNNGRILKDLNPNSEIDISELDSNIYYIEIRTKNIRTIKKIVKK